jgi:hypothetical protein
MKSVYNTYPNKYGHKMIIDKPRETNLAPALLRGGRDVTSLNRSFISSSENLQKSF